MRIHKSTLVAALMCSAPLVSAKNLFSGLYTAGNLLYISSDIESSDTEVLVGTTFNVYANKSSASGLGQGASIGYRVGMNNRFTLGASFSGFTAQVDQEETREQTLAGTSTIHRSQAFKLNHAMYPYFEGGFSPSDETLIIAKVGYGQENWDISLSTHAAGLSISNSSDIKGLIAGAEIATLIRDKILFSLSVNYSDLESIRLSAGDDNDTLEIQISPKTLSASVGVGYLPNGMIF